MYLQTVKPILDFVIALVLMIVFLPFMVILTIILTIYHRGTPFYIHRRSGKDEKIIDVVKFRTHNDYRAMDGTMYADHLTTKPLDCFLKRTSIDHSPQLLYVLTGKMSLVGPRPLLIEYLPLYSKEQYRRHEVKPGLTGWAQIHGRNAITWKERFEYDVWYVDHVSFSLDMKIIFLTILKILKGDGINQPGYFTSEKFTGNYTDLVLDKEKPFRKVWKSEFQEGVAQSKAKG